MMGHARKGYLCLSIRFQEKKPSVLVQIYLKCIQAQVCCIRTTLTRGKATLSHDRKNISSICQHCKNLAPSNPHGFNFSYIQIKLRKISRQEIVSHIDKKKEEKKTLRRCFGGTFAHREAIIVIKMDNSLRKKMPQNKEKQ